MKGSQQGCTKMHGWSCKSCWMFDNIASQAEKLYIIIQGSSNKEEGQEQANDQTC